MPRIAPPRRPTASPRAPRLTPQILDLVRGYVRLGMLWTRRGGRPSGVRLLARDLRKLGFTGKFGMGRFRVAFEHSSGWWIKVPYHVHLIRVSEREAVHYQRATPRQRRHLPRTQWFDDGVMLQAPIRHLRRLQGAVSREWRETANAILPHLTVDHHGGNVGLGTNGCVQWCDWGTAADLTAAWKAYERAQADRWCEVKLGLHPGPRRRQRGR